MRLNVQHDANGTPLMEFYVDGKKEWREFEVCAVELNDFWDRRHQRAIWMPRPLLGPGEVLVEMPGGQFEIAKGMKDCKPPSTYERPRALDRRHARLRCQPVRR